MAVQNWKSLGKIVKPEAVPHSSPDLTLLTKKVPKKKQCHSPFKGTGTRDLIWLKVVSLDRSWLVGLTDC